MLSTRYYLPILCKNINNISCKTNINELAEFLEAGAHRDPGADTGFTVRGNSPHITPSSPYRIS